MARWILAAGACVFAPGLAAQDGPTAREFCDPADPANKCPGTECRCSEDVLAIRFERSGGPILEVDDEPGVTVEATVVLETMSVGIQGWSYGVRHDGRALTIESVTTEGTDAGDMRNRSFVFLSFEGVEDCTSDPSPRCSNRVPGHGFISGTVCGIASCPELPVGGNSLGRVTYRLEPRAAEVSESGVFLEFTERLAKRNSPPVAINLTVIGRSRLPSTLVDGKVNVLRRPFHRGDPDGDGRLSVADAVSLLLFLFLSSPAPGCLEAGDFDDDGRIDTADPVLILRWLFLGGSAPAAPGPPSEPCGHDPPGSRLGCGTYAGC